MVKEIILHGKYGDGKVAIIDDEDYEKLIAYNWICNKQNYVRETKTNFLIHRMILNLPKNNLQVDHIDRNPLNNQKSNLRICNPQNNKRNQTKYKGEFSSQYKGVSWKEQCKSWVAHITTNKTEYIGMFNNEVDAAHAYDKQAIELFGDFKCLNFPDFDYSNYEIKINHTSKYYYVSKFKNSYAATISYKGKTIHIGYYNSEIMAAKHADYVNFHSIANLNRINFTNIDYNYFIYEHLSKKAINFINNYAISKV